MTKLILNNEDADNGATLAKIERDLLSQREALKSFYWNTLEEMRTKAYSSQQEQTADMIALGKVAKAMDLAFEAAGELQGIARR